MQQVQIYAPSKNAMQSGRGKTKKWLLKSSDNGGLYQEPLMGWSGSTNTVSQVTMAFSTCEEAVAFAQSQGWSYKVYQPNEKIVRPKSYADNFR